MDESLATRSAGNHRHVPFSPAPRDARAVALSSPPCNTACGALPQNGGSVAANLARGSALCSVKSAQCLCTPPCSEMAQRGSREQS